MIRSLYILVSALLLLASPVHALTTDECIIKEVRQVDNDKTVAEISSYCENQPAETREIPKRVLVETRNQNNEFVILPHRQNYILPISHISEPNQDPYMESNFYPGFDEPIENEEVKFQISLKAPLTFSNLIADNDGIYFGVTITSFWQLYNRDLSSPFRENNYRPEIFYEAIIPSSFLKGTLLTRIGIEHQSNGRTQLLSRSWNRAFIGLGYFRETWGLYLQPWYRIPEDEKEDDNDPSTPPPSEGDDNPDIEDFMGNFELTGVYKYGTMTFNTLTRYNFDENNGAIEVGMSFPLYGRLRGFLQYFNGYGESLIDYNEQIERIGIGFLLTDLL